MKWLQSEVGVGAEVAAKAPINTLIAAWQEQPVPVKDTLWHRQYRGGGKKRFPQTDALYTVESEQKNKYASWGDDSNLAALDREKFSIPNLTWIIVIH